MNRYKGDSYESCVGTGPQLRRGAVWESRRKRDCLHSFPALSLISDALQLPRFIGKIVFFFPLMIFNFDFSFFLKIYLQI